MTVKKLLKKKLLKSEETKIKSFSFIYVFVLLGKELNNDQKFHRRNCNTNKEVMHHKRKETEMKMITHHMLTLPG